MRTSIAAAIATGLLLTACTDDGAEVGFDGIASESPSPTAEPTETASAEAPSDEIDVTTTPDEVTPEWVTAVINTLLAEYGAMTAEILAMPVQDDPTLPDGFEERLSDVFDGEYLERRRRELIELLTTAAARADLYPADEIGSITFSSRLVQLDEGACIIVVGRVSQEDTRPAGTILDVLHAVSLVPSGDAGNPTPWRIRDVLPNTAPGGAPNPDEAMLTATLGDYGSSLEHGCRGDR